MSIFEATVERRQYCTVGEVDFLVTISYSLQLMGKIILRLK
jgi:hypothetical protein